MARHVWSETVDVGEFKKAIQGWCDDFARVYKGAAEEEAVERIKIVESTLDAATASFTSPPSMSLPIGETLGCLDEYLRECPLDAISDAEEDLIVLLLKAQFKISTLQRQDPPDEGQPQ